MNRNRELVGLEQFLYFVDRFKYSPSEAIKTMREHGQDMSFLDIPIKELLRRIRRNRYGSL